MFTCIYLALSRISAQSNPNKFVQSTIVILITNNNNKIGTKEYRNQFFVCTLNKEQLSFAMFLRVVCGVWLLSTLVYCQSRLELLHRQKTLNNNSYIHYTNISTGEGALNCTSPSINCCNSSENGDWRDETGRIIINESDCLYVTRREKSILLNRKNECIPELSGLRRCDISDANGETQSIFIYITITTLGILCFNIWS